MTVAVVQHAVTVKLGRSFELRKIQITVNRPPMRCPRDDSPLDPIPIGILLGTDGSDVSRVNF